MSEPLLESASSAPGFPPGDETIDRLKGLFLASLNHEIRTPLSGILGMTDLLLETPLSAEQQEYVTTTRACAENLFEILNATLEYAALSSGRLILEESEYSLAEVLDAAVASHQGKARAKGLRLASTLDPRLPETLSGDAQRLREILGHLLANAVKFTTAGQIEVRAMLGEHPSGVERLELSVADTGIGIETGGFRIEDDFADRHARFPFLAGHLYHGLAKYRGPQTRPLFRAVWRTACLR